MKTYAAIFLILISTFVFSAEKDKPEEKTLWKGDTLKGSELRSIGPSITSGRSVDIAIDTKNPGVYYVAAAAGGVWKTINNGTTWNSIFDDAGSYSIGCIAVDPND